LASALGAEGAETIVGPPLLGGHGRCSLTLAIISSGKRLRLRKFWTRRCPPGREVWKKRTLRDNWYIRAELAVLSGGHVAPALGGLHVLQGFHDLVHEAVLLRLVGGHEMVA